AYHLIVDLAGLIEPGQDRRDRYRMGDVRVTAMAHLTLMAPGRDFTGPPNQLHVGARPLAAMVSQNSATRPLQGVPARAAGPFTVNLPATRPDAGGRRCRPAQ